MNSIFEKIDQKSIKKYLIILFCTGILLMILPNLFKTDNNTEFSGGNIENTYDSQKNIKKELENILSNISGAGKVEVMIVFDNNYEKVIAKNTKSTVENNDGETSRITDSNAVMLKEGSNQTPYVVKEVNPYVRGVLVIAEGADNNTVKMNLKNAVKTVLNIPMYKVEVMTKK